MRSIIEVFQGGRWVQAAELTPIYDFAPMYLDRELIVRSCRWRIEDKRDIADINEIIDRLRIPDAAKDTVAAKIKDFAATVAGLPETMRDCGVDEVVIEHCKPYIAAQSARLDGVGKHG